MNTSNRNNTVVRSNIVTTRTFNTPAKVNCVINAYLGYGLNGSIRVKSMETIALDFGTTVASVRRLLVANGITIRGRGRVAQNA